MTAMFGHLTPGVHFEIDETVDPFGRVWWLFSCLTPGCEHVTQRASALHADLDIREHIINHHPKALQ